MVVFKFGTASCAPSAPNARSCFNVDSQMLATTDPGSEEATNQAIQSALQQEFQAGGSVNQNTPGLVSSSYGAQAIPTAAPLPGSPEENSRLLPLSATIALSVIGGSLCLLCVCFALFCLRRRRRKTPKPSPDDRVFPEPGYDSYNEDDDMTPYNSDDEDKHRHSNADRLAVDENGDPYDDGDYKGDEEYGEGTPLVAADGDGSESLSLSALRSQQGSGPGSGSKSRSKGASRTNSSRRIATGSFVNAEVEFDEDDERVSLLSGRSGSSYGPDPKAAMSASFRQDPDGSDAVLTPVVQHDIIGADVHRDANPDRDALVADGTIGSGSGSSALEPSGDGLEQTLPPDTDDATPEDSRPYLREDFSFREGGSLDHHREDFSFRNANDVLEPESKLLRKPEPDEERARREDFSVVDLKYIPVSTPLKVSTSDANADSKLNESDGVSDIEYEVDDDDEDDNVEDELLSVTENIQTEDAFQHPPRVEQLNDVAVGGSGRTLHSDPDEGAETYYSEGRQSLVSSTEEPIIYQDTMSNDDSMNTEDYARGGSASEEAQDETGSNQLSLIPRRSSTLSKRASTLSRRTSTRSKRFSSSSQEGMVATSSRHSDTTREQEGSSQSETSSRMITGDDNDGNNDAVAIVTSRRSSKLQSYDDEGRPIHTQVQTRTLVRRESYDDEGRLLTPTDGGTFRGLEEDADTDNDGNSRTSNPQLVRITEIAEKDVTAQDNRYDDEYVDDGLLNDFGPVDGDDHHPKQGFQSMLPTMTSADRETPVTNNRSGGNSPAPEDNRFKAIQDMRTEDHEGHAAVSEDRNAAVADVLVEGEEHQSSSRLAPSRLDSHGYPIPPPGSEPVHGHGLDARNTEGTDRQQRDSRNGAMMRADGGEEPDHTEFSDPDFSDRADSVRSASQFDSEYEEQSLMSRSYHSRFEDDGHPNDGDYEPHEDDRERYDDNDLHPQPRAIDPYGSQGGSPHTDDRRSSQSSYRDDEYAPNDFRQGEHHYDDTGDDFEGSYDSGSRYSDQQSYDEGSRYSDGTPYSAERRLHSPIPEGDEEATEQDDDGGSDLPTDSLHRDSPDRRTRRDYDLADEYDEDQGVEIESHYSGEEDSHGEDLDGADSRWSSINDDGHDGNNHGDYDDGDQDGGGRRYSGQPEDPRRRADPP